MDAKELLGTFNTVYDAVEHLLNAEQESLASLVYDSLTASDLSVASEACGKLKVELEDCLEVGEIAILDSIIKAV